MISGSVVFYKIATTCLLILVGYIGRRMKLIPEISVQVISKFLLSIALPSYFIYHMPYSIAVETLAANWFFPVLGALLLAESDLFGYLCGRLWARSGELGTFRIMVGLPNWVFMAMAVCEPIFKEDGIRVVLLYNLGIVLYIWSFGMTSFRSGVGWKAVVRQLFLNVQIVSCCIGLAVAFIAPFVKGMEGMDSEQLRALPWYLGVVTPVWESIYLLGGTALPLSIVQIGLLLGTPRSEHPGVDAGGNRSLVLTTLLRLLAAPLLSLATLFAACRLGLGLSRNEFVISVIVMSMPAAVLSLSITEVYGGSSRLAARGIIWGTVASLLTAPLLTLAAQRAYGWL